MNKIIDRLIRIKDGLTDRASRDAINEACGALASLPNGLPPGHVEIVTNGTRRIIPEDEPVFLLRGRDPFAPAAVEHWAEMAERGGVRAEQVINAIAHADKMRQWPTKQLPGSTRLAEEG